MNPGSNHFGIAGYYSMMAMREGLIVNILQKLCNFGDSFLLLLQGMATTNTSPVAVPTRAKEVSNLRCKGNLFCS